MSDRIILKVRSGAVIDAYATSPVQMTVVDVDMMEPGDTEEERIRKTVFDVPLDGVISPEEANQFIREIALTGMTET